MNNAEAGRTFLSLGSNLGDRLGNLRMAVDRIDRMPGAAVLRTSSVYETSPWGVTDQPAFLNCVCELLYGYDSHRLLAEIGDIETALGRVREARWRERTIDIDILFHGGEILQSDDLIIPHASMKNRAFVLVPLNEIAPDVRYPGSSVTIGALLAACRDPGSVRLVARPLVPVTMPGRGNSRPIRPRHHSTHDL